MNSYWLAGIVVVLLVGYLSRRGERADSTRKQIRTGGNPAPTTDIDGLLRAGQKIEAITAIDARARELGK